jgi:hypothetical protein
MNPDQKSVEEVAKAAAEVAKFGTQAVSTTEKILGFAARIFKEPAEQASGIIGDRLRLYRWERQIAYVDKVNSLIETKNIHETRAVSPKFALPILEGASLEEDDTLQQLWANLTVNALDPDFSLDLRMTYIEIIKTLTVLDVRMLKKFYDLMMSTQRVDLDNTMDYSLTKEQLRQALAINSHDYEVCIFNLFRAQCLAPAVIVARGIKLDGEPPTAYKGSKQVTITPLGLDFVRSALQ